MVRLSYSQSMQTSKRVQKSTSLELGCGAWSYSTTKKKSDSTVVRVVDMIKHEERTKLMTMTMTMTLRQVRPTMSEAREKESVKTNGTCAVGKVRTCTLLMTVCSYIEQNTNE